MLDNFFHDVFDHNFGGIMVIEDDLRIRHMNKACEEITGFSEKEATGKFCYEVLRTKCCKDTCPINMGKKGKKGAFTDARKDKPGLFLAAHQGTLFLDEK